MSVEFYPLKFQPQLKEKIWGGDKLVSMLSKNAEGIEYGESWEISDVEGSESIIDNGQFKGKSLRWLLNNHASQILGANNHKRFGTSFPLLIKYIDAKTDLSVQLHPDDTLAKERHNSFGKTEMWYVMQADEDANLIIGFKEDIDQKDYIEHVNANTLVDVLNFIPVNEGDTFFIEAGRIHAIGGGILLAEIQQTSDITYRVYDWDRVDNHGQARELHIDEALDAIDFTNDDSFKINYPKQQNVSNKMVNCDFFKTNFLKITTRITRRNTFGSFIIYMCVKGTTSIHYKGTITQLNYGETLLVPAAMEEFQISSEFAELLEIYV